MRVFKTPSPAVNFMAKAVFKAGSLLIRDFGEILLLQNSLKGSSAFAQTSLKRTEKILLEALDSSYPIYTPEQAQAPEAPSFFVIDALEGFTNFQRGIPCFAITATFYEEEELGQVVVYDPIKDEMFWSCAESGTYLNQTRLRVSSRQTLTGSIGSVYFDFTNMEEAKHSLDLMGQLYQKGMQIQIQNVFSLDVGYLAGGRYDAFWTLHPSKWQKDILHLMTTKAGGFVHSTPQYQAAANEKIFNKICEF